MAEQREVFDNFIHLSVAIQNAAGTMIEEIGVLKGMRRRHDYDHHPRNLLDLRKAVSKAARALESYDAMISSGNLPSTGAEFDAARNLAKSEAEAA